jgi:hypothetical protein
MERKKTAFSVQFALLSALLLFSLVNCSQKNAGKDVAGSDDCLVGEWKFTSNGTTKSFSFRGDQTGNEVQSPTDVRPFRWRKANQKISIIYMSDPSRRTWDFTLNCDQAELKIFGLSYKKI